MPKPSTGESRRGRPRTGAVQPFRRKDGTVYHRARLTLADGSRPWADIPEKYSASLERSRHYAAALQEREDETGEILAAKRKSDEDEARQRDPRNGETCTAYRERLDAYRKELGRRSGKDDKSTWKVWIAERIGHLAVSKVTRDDVEAVRDALDEAIALHKKTGGGEGVSAKRARNVWVVVTTTFKAACMAKRRDLRVRDDNPCSGVLPPERGQSRSRTFIYPNEAAALFACGDVSLEWRELYAVACYTFLRPGELQVLTCADVDLEAGVVHVTKAWDERSREVKAPKTRNGIRDVPIHPNLAPLLARMVKGRGAHDLVVPVMSAWYEDARAKRTREHLAKAGVNRPRLTENTATTMMVGFRTWRDTGITWLALAGIDVAKIQRRAGHDEISTTMGYVKSAEDISGTIGEPFPPLPTSLLGDSTSVQPSRPAAGESSNDSSKPTRGPRAALKNAAFLRRGRDSNTGEPHDINGLGVDSRGSEPTPTDVNPRTLVALSPSAERTDRSVEDALADAIASAAPAGRWDVVAQLARELEARRLASSNVVTLDAKRRRE